MKMVVYSKASKETGLGNVPSMNQPRFQTEPEKLDSSVTVLMMLQHIFMQKCGKYSKIIPLTPSYLGHFPLYQVCKEVCRLMNQEHNGGIINCVDMYERSLK